MTVLTLSNPSPGTLADANVIASNNNAILAVINGNLDDSNIKTAAGIAASKLAGYPSDATKTLKGDGTWGTAAGALQQIVRTTNPGSSWDTNVVLGGVLPTTYNHLLIIYTIKGDAGGAPRTLQLRYNADSGANYYYQVAWTNNNTATGDDGAAATSAEVVQIEGTINGTTLNARGSVLIPDYRETNYQKGYIATGGAAFGAAAGQMFATTGTGWWNNTAAVTRIQLFPDTGNFAAGTIISLYGIV